MVKPVDVDVLSALLRRSAELPDLEYKLTWNPSEKRDLVELCKDFAAMESLPDGGYVVVGANDDGSPGGTFSPADPRDYDEQKIRSKVVKVLGEPLDLCASLLTWENSTYLLIGIGPHHDGMRIMAKAPATRAVTYGAKVMCSCGEAHRVCAGINTKPRESWNASWRCGRRSGERTSSRPSGRRPPTWIEPDTWTSRRISRSIPSPSRPPN